MFPAVIIPILAILFTGGCAGLQTPPTIIFNNNTHLVRLDLDRSIGGPGDPDRHTHPIAITNNQFHTILSATHVQEYRALLQRMLSGPGKKTRVFSEHDITVLTPQLHKALLNATPQQFVVFAVIHPGDTQHEVTAGELFVNGNRLHLILHCFQSPTGDGSLNPLCGSTRRQEYDLSFAEEQYFIDFGHPFFGYGNKEIIVDYTSIPSATASHPEHLVSRAADTTADDNRPSSPISDEALSEPHPIHMSESTTSASLPQPANPSDALQPFVAQEPLTHTSPAADATSAHCCDHIRMRERQADTLRQVISKQRADLAMQSPQHHRSPRILLLRTPLMRGQDVADLQRALGFSADQIDGIFGRETDRAVRTFQRERGMIIDGKVGPDTRNALKTLP